MSNMYLLLSSDQTKVFGVYDSEEQASDARGRLFYYRRSYGEGPKDSVGYYDCKIVEFELNRDYFAV